MAKTFYSDASMNGFQPKRKFRWTISFKNLGEELVFMATKTNKPTYELGDKTHRFLNHEYKFPGIIKWNDVECSFIDAKEPNIGSKFYHALINSGYKAPETFNDALQGITKTTSVATVGDVVIRQLDGGDVNLAGIDPGSHGGVHIAPDILDEWTLKNAFITKVSFGDGLAYDSDDLVEIGVTLKYDWAKYSGAPKQYPTG